jgi:glycosyltransferase involved in cell wall biosynthesis
MVTVGMTCYNGAKTVKRALTSITEQEKVEDLEIIFVNDGSTDNTQEVIEEFCRARPTLNIKVLNNKSNLGTVTSRNHLLQIAQGRYFAWLDSDDWWSPYKLAGQLALITRDSGLVGVTTRCVYYQGEKQVFYWQPENFHQGYVSSDAFFYNWWAASSFLFDLMLLRKSGFAFLSQNETAEDYQLYISCLKLGYVSCSRRGLTHIEGLPTSESAAKRARQIQACVRQRERAIKEFVSDSQAILACFQAQLCDTNFNGKDKQQVDIQGIGLWLDALSASNALKSKFGMRNVAQVMGKYWLRFNWKIRPTSIGEITKRRPLFLKVPNLQASQLFFFWIGALRHIYNRLDSQCLLVSRSSRQ